MASRYLQTRLIVVFSALLLALSACGNEPSDFTGKLDAGGPADADGGPGGGIDGGTTPCTFDCVPEEVCVSRVGTISPNMTCEGSKDVCCAIVIDCEFDCMPYSECAELGGVLRADQICRQAGLCCERPCKHECMTHENCDATGGEANFDMTCENTEYVCCEPGAGYCQNTCVLPMDCPAGEERNGLCVNEDQACCNVRRCAEEGGACRQFSCLFGLQTPRPEFYCPGNYICCK